MHGQKRFSEVGRGTGKRTYEDSDQKHDPDLRIKQNLLELAPLKAMILDTSLVHTHMLKKRPLFHLRQPLSLHRRIRQYQHHNHAHQTRNESQHNEHYLPALQIGIWANMLKSKTNKPPDNLTQSQSAVPNGEARSLLGFGVPLGTNEHEAGSDGCFEDAKEDAGC